MSATSCLSRSLIAATVATAAWLMPAAAPRAATPAAPAASAPLPYDESADARSDLNLALERARAEHKQVLVVFGANWCPDCRELAAKMGTGSLAELVAKRYVVTKVDVARFNKNTDLSQQMGDPIRKGIPAVAVLDADGALRKATLGGELASARKMGDADVLQVFEGLGSPR